MGPGHDEEYMGYVDYEEPHKPEQALADHRLLDLRKTESVEFHVAEDGRVWVNVDGKCVLRIAKTGYYDVRTPDGTSIIVKV
jgi:hypothetical protein